MTMQNSEKLMTTKELADAHGVSLRTLERWKSKGFRMPGRRATFTELRAWLAESGGRRRNMSCLR